MDPRSTLLAQIHMTGDNLRRAEGALSSPKLDADLRRKMAALFSVEINKLKRRHADLVAHVEHGLPLRDCWGQLAYLAPDCAKVLDECLAFIEGALLRSAALDDGLCRVADALLAELDGQVPPEFRWDRLTIIGEDDSIANTAGIIRLQFPEFTIWHLPIVAHELGHYIAGQLKPVEELIDDLASYQDAPANTKSLLGELFADLFAVYTVGPAFAYTSVLLRFNPTSVRDGETHPSDAKRVHFILKALERTDDAGSYYGVIRRLREKWAASLEEVEEATPVDTQAAAKLDAWLGKFLLIIEDQLPPSLRYRTWAKAIRLAESQLRPEGRGDAYSITDVLNAAWRARVSSWDEPAGQTLERRALGLCEHLAGRNPAVACR